MRNFTLLSVILLGLAGNIFAQDMKLIYRGNTTVNGDYVYVIGSATDLDISENLWVENTTSDTLDIEVTTYELDVVTGTLNATCWEICPPADTSGQNPIRVSPNVVRLNPAGIDYSFAGHLYPENTAGCSHFRYVFEGTSTTSGAVYRDSVDYYVNHGVACSAVGVESIENNQNFFKVFPNPAKEYVNILFSNEVEATEIVITNVLGQVVKTQMLNAATNNIELSVQDLSAGIYFVSAILNNEQRVTERIQVSK
jgi:hypothetical protein